MGAKQDYIDRLERQERLTKHYEEVYEREANYVPPEAKSATIFYVMGRTFPEQKYKTYAKAVEALYDVPEFVVKYDGGVCLAGYDENGDIVFSTRRCADEC